LIVDDEPLTRNFLFEKIPALNSVYEVAGCCGDGKEALDFLFRTEIPVDLVLTDIKMPVMDGLEFLRQARKSFPHIPVVILSGFGEFDFARQAIQYGVSDYILKPIVNRELELLLEKMADLIDAEKREILEKQRIDTLLARLMKEQNNGSLKGSNALIVTENPREEKPGIVDAAIAYILKNYYRPISLFMAAEETGVSASYLSGLFHRKTGESYVKFLTRVRMEAAAQYLVNFPVMLISDIAVKIGRLSSKHFLYMFKKYFGVTPTEYRRAKGIEGLASGRSASLPRS
jgi:YesN/AraC family two-component response regulator